MRVVLVLLILASLAGALDNSWRSPVLFVIPALAAVCWVLLGRLSRLERQLGMLEKMFRAARNDIREQGFSSSGEVASPASEPDRTVPRPVPAPRQPPGGVPEDFVFSAADEIPIDPFPAPTTPVPSGIQRLWNLIRDWLTGGNPVVKVGLIVLFFGVSFLLKYAAEHSLLPVELRMAGAGALGIALLVLGWRLRESRPVYALLVQGGGVGVLYLTIFAATRFFGMLSPLWGLGLMSLIVVFSGILAVLQNASGLAVFGAAGGFLAPVLLSTGQGSHVHLFGYYALLNMGVLGIAWHRTWRVLNLLGFACTFGIGAVWGARYYRPEYFSSVEPFLILFFTTYGIISVLFARATHENQRVRLDSALVFGLPLAAFGLQMGLVRGMDMGGAYSCLVLALWYVLSAKLLRDKGAGLALLSEAHLALGVIFVSLAVPMALNATWTASTWALEGAGMIWLGQRQNRLVTRAFGIILQAGAALSLALTLSHVGVSLEQSQLLAGIFLALGGIVSSWAYWPPRSGLHAWEESASPAFGVWGALCWYGIWLSWTAGQPHGAALFVAVVTASLLAWLVLQRRTTWPMPRFLAQATPVIFFLFAVGSFEHPGAGWGWLAWIVAVSVLFAVFHTLEGEWEDLPRGWAHTFCALLVMVLILREADGHLARLVPDWPWADAVTAGVGVLLLLTVVHAPLSWPLRRHAPAYLRAGAALSLVLALWWAQACLSDGDPHPLPHIPVLNPLDLVQALVILVLAQWARAAVRANLHWARDFERAMPGFLAGAGFVWLNLVVARTVHFHADVPYTLWSLFHSEVLQSALAVFWSLAALAAMLFGGRQGRRKVWLAGAVLLGVVVLKLFLIDLDGRGTVARIVSFLAVGLLMLVVGYFCPLPPKEVTQ